MNPLKRVCLLLFFFVPLQSGDSFAYSALEMKSNCQELVRTSEGGKWIKNIPSALCAATFTQIRQAMNFIGTDGKRIFAPCVPKSVKMYQIVLIYLKEAEKSPERLHYPVMGFTINALIEKFPCKK